MKASHADSNVLISGESGTGKELFARGIHYMSKRKYDPFVPVNCAAIPENLLESELFGYEEGAFTGAKKSGKLGKFDMANNGTIFLDEIGDLQFHLQAKLLRVLQNGVIERVGSEKPIPIDTRVIAATNKDLVKMVEEGRFREDLYYRLNVIPITIPPLRDRGADIEKIAKALLERYNHKMKKIIVGFDEQVMRAFNDNIWMGNIREMENIIEYCMIVDENNIIQMDDLPPHFIRMTATHEKSIIIPLAELEKQTIKKALIKYGTSKKGLVKAANALGISLSTLYRRIGSTNNGQ